VYKLHPLLLRLEAHKNNKEGKNKSKKENIKDFIIKIIDNNGHCTTILFLYMF
jgi:hypothetical protein